MEREKIPSVTLVAFALTQFEREMFASKFYDLHYKEKALIGLTQMGVDFKLAPIFAIIKQTIVIKTW